MKELATNLAHAALPVDDVSTEHQSVRLTEARKQSYTRGTIDIYCSVYIQSVRLTEAQQQSYTVHTWHWTYTVQCTVFIQSVRLTLTVARQQSYTRGTRHLLYSVRLTEGLIRSFCSNQLSDCEQFAQIAQDK